MLGGMQNKDDFITATDLAESLSVHPKTLLRWAKAGKIPAVSVGDDRKVWIFHRPTISKWAADRSWHSLRQPGGVVDPDDQGDR